ncbi:hypothetical protein NDN08_002466 [Rhodosorus marinus]|uniref:VTT domain-containing protein n=1 Tax=Rhodosorus marinus TaxID=101924 RepID=A0AAV8UTT3_9RHOD|nr:hypothetical protein NDN08_002466 [Rhodosorus marinus]
MRGEGCFSQSPPGCERATSGLGFVQSGAWLARGRVSRSSISPRIARGQGVRVHGSVPAWNQRRNVVSCTVQEEANGRAALSSQQILGLVTTGVIVGGGILAGSMLGGRTMDFVRVFSDWVLSLGPAGSIAYGLMYTLLEIFAVPALPLTVGCGYLFGPVKGTAIVSLSSTAAAGLSFIISRYALRDVFGRLAANNAKFRAIDKAVSKEGFKYTLLLRLSPLLPFALSNYLYGLTSLRFAPYILGSWLGMLPGTIAYVYGGAAAGELSNVAGGSGSPNYALLAIGGLATVAVLYNVTKLANGAMEDEGAETTEHKNIDLLTGAGGKQGISK